MVISITYQELHVNTTTPTLIKDEGLASKFSYLNSSLSVCIVKDIDSVYQSMSRSCLKMTGWKSHEQAIGQTDYDIPCDNARFANQFRNLDKQVMTKNCRALALDIMHSSIGWISFLAEKIPLTNKDGKVIGVFCNAIDISSLSLFKYSQILRKVDSKIINSYDKAAKYILTHDHSPLPLTQRQQECVFLLIRGKTLKQIADILNLSVRTIESYVEAIKYRLGCTHKTQIIEKAIANEFLYFIPESFLKKDIGSLIT